MGRIVLFFLTGRARADGHLQLELWDEDMIGKDDRLGHVSIALEGLNIANRWGDGTRKWYKVMGATGRVDVTLALIDESEDGEEELDGDIDPSANIGGTDEERANALLAGPMSLKQKLIGKLAPLREGISTFFSTSSKQQEVSGDQNQPDTTRISEILSQDSYSSSSSNYSSGSDAE